MPDMDVGDRYARQLILPEIGAQGQAKLARARVLLVGVGGLGSPIASYLAGAGVGWPASVEGGVVAVSELQRLGGYGEGALGGGVCRGWRKMVRLVNGD